MPFPLPVFGVYTALVFLAMGLVTLALLLVIPSPSLRAALGHHSARWLLLCIAVRIRRVNPENMPAGACIVVSNHASYLDGVVLKAVLPPHFH